MISTSYRNYKVHKDNVIDLFDGYKKFRGNRGDGVDLEFLESRVESLKNGKYTLAVAGEVKAGKSTFINALLGEELLPSDVLQTTSAIVEILKAEQPYLKIKYASGNEITFNHKEMSEKRESFQKLIKEVCSISDEYREIPTTLLDDLIINQEKIEVNEELIKDLERKSHLDLKDKIKLIRDYIEKHPKDKIPIEIQIGFPLKWVFDELRIVDSPGVNAIGGVQDVSFEYFNEANAIIFIHRIDPIESKSFRDFVSSIITERSRETLFLVLTHAGLKTDNDVERLYNEAKRLFKDYISEEKILVVDSLLRLIYNDLQNGLSIEQIEQSSTYKADILPKFQKKAEKEKRDLKEILLEYSKFEKMLDTIDKFSLEAPRLQLKEIVEKIKNGYKNLEEQLVDEINLKEKKKENPQKFEEEIERIKAALTKYENLTLRTKEEVEQSYTGRHSSWNEKINELKEKYQKLIKSATTIENIRKLFTDACNEINKIAIEFSKSISKKLNAELEDSGKKFKEEYKITIPKVDLDAIEQSANKRAYKLKPIYKTITESLWENWNFFKFKWTKKSRTYRVKVRDEEVFDENIAFDYFKLDVIDKLKSIVNDLPDKFKEVIQIYLNTFKEKIKELIEGRKIALDEMREKKQSNDELIKEIQELNKKKESIQPELKRVQEILENLE